MSTLLIDAMVVAVLVAFRSLKLQDIEHFLEILAKLEPVLYRIPAFLIIMLLSLEHVLQMIAEFARQWR